MSRGPGRGANEKAGGTNLLDDAAKETTDPGTPWAVRDGAVGVLDLGVECRGLLDGLVAVGGRGGPVGLGRRLLGEGLLEVVVGDVHGVWRSCPRLSGDGRWMVMGSNSESVPAAVGEYGGVGVFAHGSQCRHISLMDGLFKVGCPMLPEPTTAPAIFEEVRACGGGVPGHWTRTGQDLLSRAGIVGTTLGAEIRLQMDTGH